MKLVEQHVIKRGDPRYPRLDAAAYASKNLWNAANYLVRQSFILQRVYLNHTAVFHLLKEHEAYQALPRKVSNQVLIQLHKAWVGFFEAMEAWREHPERFTGRPKLPGYKHKTEGRNLLVYQEKAKPAAVDPALFVEASLGVSVLAALTSNKPGFIPRLVNGKPSDD